MVTFMIQIADFLNTVLISNSFIFVNLWSVIHCGIGFLLMKIFLINKKDRFFKLFGLLVLYEIFHILVIFSGSNLFRAEIGQDIFYDLIWGVVGGWLATKFW